MKIKIDKKKIILIGILIILIPSAILSLYLLKRKLEEPYKKLFNYCTQTQEEYNNNHLENCKVFLDNFYRENNKNCLDIVVPEKDPSERNIKLCFRKGVVINWENPYDNYDLNIPIILKINYNLFPIISTKGINIELMNDQDAHNLIYSVNQETDKLILYRSAQATKEIKEKGYYLSTKMCNPSSDGLCTILGIYEVKLVDYDIEEGKLIFNLEISILGQNINETVEVDRFQYEEYSYSDISKSLIKETLNLDSNLDNFLSKGGIYQMEFSIDVEDITDSLIKKYSEKDSDLDLILNRMIHYVD